MYMYQFSNFSVRSFFCSVSRAKNNNIVKKENIVLEICGPWFKAMVVVTKNYGSKNLLAEDRLLNAELNFTCYVVCNSSA